MDTLGKKGIFFGYNELSKEYRVYIPSYRNIKTRRDVTFDEDTTFRRSNKNHLDEVCDEDPGGSRVTYKNTKKHVPEDHEMIEPQKPEDPPREKSYI